MAKKSRRLEVVKKPNGRPPFPFGANLGARILDQIANGSTLNQALRGKGMPSKSTFLKWVKNNPDFADQYEEARKAQALNMRDEIVEIADDARNDWMERERKDGTIETVVDAENIARSRLRVETRKWIMERTTTMYAPRSLIAGDPKAPVNVVITRFSDNPMPLIEAKVINPDSQPIDDIDQSEENEL